MCCLFLLLILQNDRSNQSYQRERKRRRSDQSDRSDRSDRREKEEERKELAVSTVRPANPEFFYSYYCIFEMTKRRRGRRRKAIETTMVSIFFKLLSILYTISEAPIEASGDEGRMYRHGPILAGKETSELSNKALSRKNLPNPYTIWGTL